ncbi:MAG: hypothetical protein NZM31_02315 [Gemmatales bacterium]|nr:hypothetical protein [Gemmatales bacterium]MDW8385832.1 hypothetical protein [Gemmatales bacterium]
MGANPSGKRHIDRLKRRRREEKRLLAKLAAQQGSETCPSKQKPDKPQS